jgi:hypothetical protein
MPAYLWIPAEVYNENRTMENRIDMLRAAPGSRVLRRDYHEKAEFTVKKK